MGPDGTSKRAVLGFTRLSTDGRGEPASEVGPQRLGEVKVLLSPDVRVAYGSLSQRANRMESIKTATNNKPAIHEDTTSEVATAKVVAIMSSNEQ